MTKVELSGIAIEADENKEQISVGIDLDNDGVPDKILFSAKIKSKLFWKILAYASAGIVIAVMIKELLGV